jgi:hypothetical protein
MCNICDTNKVVDPYDETICVIMADCSREEYFVIDENKCDPC